jgi:glucose/arabinose dehydrogenase
VFRAVSFRTSLFLAMAIVVVSNGSIPVLGRQQQYYDGRHFTQISLDGGSPQLTDPNLRLEEVASGLENPTAMAFLGDSGDNILVTEKNNGNVKLVIDGEVQDEPLIDVEVANNNGTNERGLLGMAVIDATDEAAAAAANSTETTTTTYVFLYFTESGGGEDGDDAEGVVPTGNRLYRYELTRGENNSGITVMDSQLLLDLPAIPGPRYNGGPILATYENVDNNSNNAAAAATITIYLMIGDLDHRETQAQNFEDGSPPDGTSGILRVDSEGNPFPDAILVDEEDDDDDDSMLQYYYAYGIRNSFGMDFDPVTGNIWDTENGPEFGDEINLVEPGFNSGWADVQGLMSKLEENLAENNVVGVEDVEDVELVDFGRGNYSDPEFAWQIPVGVTSIKFFNSPNLGEQYQNDMFVGDINDGILYNFDLNEDRTGLELDGALADKVANSNDDLSDVIFGTGFNGITDIEVGPDGYLYILLYGGTIYRVVPQEEEVANN